MADLSRHYVSGQEIHAGDRVLYAGVPGRIVFVLGFHEFLPEFVEGKEWYYEEFGQGFMLEQDGGGLFFSEDSDEDLEFVSRGRTDAAS